jgi:ElaB/YqjD/DUF883 family membrane-anchored ribosome-binding protein
MTGSDKLFPTADTIDHVAEKIDQGIDEAASKAQGAIEKIAEAGRPAVENLAAGAHCVIDKIVTVTAQATEVIGAKGEQLHEIQQQLVEDCRTYVRAKPVTAVAIALALGYILSSLCKSR